MRRSNWNEHRATGGKMLSFVRQVAEEGEVAGMPTKLEKELKREIQIGTKPYVLRIDPLGLKLTEKGHRKGLELSWDALVDGEAALAAALNASVKEGA
jgi:hypothetical protein